jgi:hypothetical protein
LKSEAFAKAKRVAPRQAIHIGSTPATRFRGDAAIFGRLVEDHDRHRALFSMIEASERTSPDRAKIDDQFADLAARSMKLKGWLRRFGEAKKLYLHHIREEEQEQFVESQKVLTPADQRYMRGVFNRRKREEKAKARVTPKIKLNLK